MAEKFVESFITLFNVLAEKMEVDALPAADTMSEEGMSDIPEEMKE